MKTEPPNALALRCHMPPRVSFRFGSVRSNPRASTLSVSLTVSHEWLARLRLCSSHGMMTGRHDTHANNKQVAHRQQPETHRSINCKGTTSESPSGSSASHLHPSFTCTHRHEPLNSIHCSIVVMLPTRHEIVLTWPIAIAVGHLSSWARRAVSSPILNVSFILIPDRSLWHRQRSRAYACRACICKRLAIGV